MFIHIVPHSPSIICEVISEVRDKVVALHSVAEAVAALDLIVALTHATSVGGWVRPAMAQPGGCHMRVLKGRHPILDLVSNVPPVPNDTVGGISYCDKKVIISTKNL